MRIVRRIRGRRLKLDDADSRGEKEKCGPLLGGKAAAEEEDGEESGGENLEIVGDLESRNVEIGRSDELQLHDRTGLALGQSVQRSADARCSG